MSEKEEKKKIVQELKEVAGISEPNEPNEANEPLSVQDLMDDGEEQSIAQISGKLKNGNLYWTTFFFHKGKYLPFVITEDKQVIQVQERKVKQKYKKKDKDGNEVEEERLMPTGEFYFEYAGEIYHYTKLLFFKRTYRINIPSKRILRLINQKIDKKKLWDKLLSSVKEYFDHSNTVEYSLSVSETIKTFIHWGLGRTYYTLLQGKEDTGKTTMQRYQAKVQMYGWFGGKSSMPVMARFKHFFGIAANIDEFEKMHKEEKTNAMGIMNTGFNVGGTYNFVNTNKKKIEDQIQVLDTFGSNSFSSNSLDTRWDFDKSFLSRCYPLISTRKKRKTKDIYNPTEEELNYLQSLTDEVFVYCLTNYKVIEESINYIKEELEKEGIFGRQTDMYSIILGIIRHFKGDYSAEMEELKQKEGIERKEELDTFEGAIFTYLTQLFQPKKNSVRILNKEIRRFVNNHLNLPEDKQINPKTIGAILRRFNLTTREDQIKRTGEGYEYTIGLNQFMDMLQRYGFKHQLEGLEVSSYGSNGSNGSSENELNEANELNEPTSKLQFGGDVEVEKIK